jgi:glycosyltransferase involved in cell wall biosynthesis
MPADFRWRTGALRRGLAACDALVAPTAEFAAATARTHGVPLPFVVHNGRHAAARTSRRDPFIFTSGRLWDEGKNARVLDEAAGLAGIKLYAAGPLAGPGCALVPQHLSPLGRLPAQDVEDWLSRAPVYASAALYEPFGLGVLEAAQAGCALVLSDVPTFRELWEGAALFLDPRRADGFAAAFERLLADEIETRRLGTLAKARAKRFTVESMTRGVLGVYREMKPRSEAAA